MQLFVAMSHLFLIPFLCLTLTALSYGGETTINVCDQIIPEATIPKHFMKGGVSQTFRTWLKDVNCPTTAPVYNQSTEIDPTILISKTGVLSVQNIGYFLQDQYCVSRFNESSIEVKYCDVRCGDTHTCIIKCCPPDEVIHISEFGCANSGNNIWKPTFYKEYRGCGEHTSKQVNYHFLVREVDIQEQDLVPYKHVTKRVPTTNETAPVEVVEGFRFRLMDDGNLWSQDSFGKWIEIKNDKFCIDGIMGYVGSDEDFSGRLEDQAYFSYPEQEHEQEEAEMETSSDIYEVYDEAKVDAKQVVIVVLFKIGAVFLLLTVALYLLIWEKHNIHGWTIFSFVITMFLMYIFLGTSHLLSISGNSDLSGSAGCRLVGILAHFFYLSTMCWLTIINVDLWLTFRNIKPTGGRTKNISQYVLYLLFAFGIPMLIVVFAVVADTVYTGAIGDGTECEPPIVLPLYGVHQCYIQPKAEPLYLHIPMAILLSCNVLTFSSTVFTLCLYRNQTRNATSGSTSHNKESIVLFTKLFVVTGVSWILEVLSNVFQEPKWVWIIFDSYNVLQAVLIFLIFAVKRENVVFLYGKYPRARFLLRPIMRTKCCYVEAFNPEKTEMTGVAMDRNSRIHFRRGSDMSTTQMGFSGGRRDS
ncbi:unnamed protein product [Orchesella dallaii]|uniref:G-protein coupled receptors family 2 profile 2 domain-containing protein n=1 Tax=Orchesella dallaii TaxID=48710 RepID=A0ABP1Q949_9HEXA